MSNGSFPILYQQDVLSLRPEDLFMVVQGGTQKRLKVAALLGYLSSIVTQMTGSIPANVSAFANDVPYLTQSSIASFVTTTALNGTLASYPTTSVMNAAIAAANIPKLYSGPTLVANPVEYVNTVALTTAGTVTFSLTDASGNALFTSVKYMKAEVSDATNSYNYAYTVATDKKSVAVAVMKSSATFISLLGISVLGAPANAPVGTVVNLLVKGN